jgi:hypothetical protein
MRRARRGAAKLASIGLLVSGLACATTTRVGVDETHDFSSLRTWDWHGRVAHLIGGYKAGRGNLDALLGGLIEASLAERGYARSRSAPDFFVTYDFKLQRRVKLVDVPRAPYLLSSHHSSPSYWIEGTQTARILYRQLQLAVAVMEPGGRIVWKGVVEREIEDGQKVVLADVVAGVIERFPKAPDTPPEAWAVVEN